MIQNTQHTVHTVHKTHYIHNELYTYKLNIIQCTKFVVHDYRDCVCAVGAGSNQKMKHITLNIDYDSYYTRITVR